MKIAFCLHKYFPYGGQQRDFKRIALACQQRGHQVVVYTFEWQGEKCPGFEVVLVPKQGSSNHARNHFFSRWIADYRRSHPDDLLVGFNKMAGLDIYFAADVCYAAKTAKEKGFLYKLTPRYRSYCQAENAVFSTDSNTEILVLTPQQKTDFIQFYQTSNERFHLLSPGIDPQLYSSQQRDNYRQETRQRLGLTSDDFFLLQVGSDFRRKGVKRSIAAIAALPSSIKDKVTFWVVGADNAASCRHYAEKLGIAAQVHFHQGRDDIPQLMAAADLLLHPAHQEAAGIVLIEALASGLPVICTEVCGNAPYLSAAGNGRVISEPFDQETFNQVLSDALQDPHQLALWSQAGLTYCEHHDVYRLPEQAADIIEKRVKDAATRTAF
ncbi:glycosyltransferase family 4 protein [Rosenbergiella epipactidis]|uniref:glycosyltransferase family 4 protein n=1 Tax=Rosenbergiella epipactidis TaxID=1544694 RepID=UPI001BDA30E8|nr:glycosyltransferase family 4 protein [Rosenbergiella epipactidis]